ncbi:MAG: trigger factor [Candidatus Paceibacterota bacterium]
MKTTIKKLEKSEIEIVGSIEVAEFEKYEGKALERIGERLELPGFRKGKAPSGIVKENVQEMELLEETAELALMDNYMKILEENKIDAIGRPQIAITKIGKGSDLEFKIVTAVLPEMKLPDYKKIAKEQSGKEDNKREIIVDEKDVEKVILDLRKMRAEQARGSNHVGHENMTEEPARPHDHSGAGGEHAKAHAESASSADKIPESEYPIFDDAFAKTFGDFKDAGAFKEKIRSNIKIEKETEQKDKLRLVIVEELVKLTEGEIPEILIESEIDKIMYRLEADITNAGLKLEDYLKQINKTDADLRKEWRADAEKRAKLQMIIHTISEKENLKPTEEEIVKDVTQITTMYKDADPTRARSYVEQMLENEKVFKFLETQ